MIFCFALFVIIEIILMSRIIKRMKKKGSRKLFRVLATLGFLVVIGITLHFVIFPPVGEIPVTGQYHVSYEDYWLDEDRDDPYIDNGENRQLWIRKWTPVNCDESAGVVVASHGSCGTIDNNRSLYREMASRGYTVLAVAHSGQAAAFTYKNGKSSGPSMIFLKQMTSINPDMDPEGALKTYNEWMDIRINDLNTVMDDYKAQHGDAKFVVMGHSLGGSAAYAMARVRDDVTGCIALESPFMYDIISVENSEFVFNEADYEVPLLNIYSDAGHQHIKDWGEYGNNRLFMNSTDPRYTSITYSGIGHMGLCDLSRQSPVLTAILDGGFQKVNARIQLDMMNEDCIEWLDSVTGNK